MSNQSHEFSPKDSKDTQKNSSDEELDLESQRLLIVKPDIFDNNIDSLNQKNASILTLENFDHLSDEQVFINMNNDIQNQQMIQDNEFQKEQSMKQYLSQSLFENLDIFIKILEKLFDGNPPNDQELQQLNDYQIMIFNFIQEKKFTDDSELSLNLNCLNLNKQKRIEEMQKMFFKKAFNFVESSFFKNKKTTSKKKKLKNYCNFQEFYQFFFGNLVKKLNISIENFYHPQKKVIQTKKPSKIDKTAPNKIKIKESKSPGQKSFNQTYIDLILKSSKFRTSVKSYLKHQFLQEYFESRPNKILKIIQQCQKKIDKIGLVEQLSLFQDENKLKQNIKENLKLYILMNQKAKIPWSKQDIEVTQQFASNMIVNSENQNFYQ